MYVCTHTHKHTNIINMLSLFPSCCPFTFTVYWLRPEGPIKKHQLYSPNGNVLGSYTLNHLHTHTHTNKRLLPTEFCRNMHIFAKKHILRSTFCWPLCLHVDSNQFSCSHTNNSSGPLSALMSVSIITTSHDVKEMYFVPKISTDISMLTS